MEAASLSMLALSAVATIASAEDRKPTYLEMGDSDSPLRRRIFSVGGRRSERKKTAHLFGPAPPAPPGCDPGTYRVQRLMSIRPQRSAEVRAGGVRRDTVTLPQREACMLALKSAATATGWDFTIRESLRIRRGECRRSAHQALPPVRERVSRSTLSRAAEMAAES